MNVPSAADDHLLTRRMTAKGKEKTAVVTTTTTIMMMMMMVIAGLDNKRSDSTCGRHTIFIGTKPASMALMDDKNLIDFLLDEIFRA